MSQTRLDIKALTFDVFGTTVDWRGSIIREGRRWSKSKGLEVDWGAFADAWRAGYRPAMDRVRRRESPWMKLDALHRLRLEELLPAFGLTRLSETEKDHLNRVWHRLKPWPDTLPGMRRLRKRYLLATLSNGNIALLANMAKAARLPWDCILSAELAGHYKPDKETYLMAVDLLGLAPQEIMMVAAHKDDLHAARSHGFRTAFVRRPLEHGPAHATDLRAVPEFDFNADDFVDLAAQLRL